MSRSGYSDDCENVGLWRGAVGRAMLGQRGQKTLRELLAALDALPVKELAAESLVADDGRVCALGALGVRRGLDMAPLEGADPGDVGEAFGIARAMAAEIVYENDECGLQREPETPVERWIRMRAWVASQIVLTESDQ